MSTRAQDYGLSTKRLMAVSKRRLARIRALLGEAADTWEEYDTGVRGVRIDVDDALDALEKRLRQTAGWLDEEQNEG